MERTIDVSTNLSTQVAPDTINVEITLQGAFKTREECTAKYNMLHQTIKTELEKNGLSASLLKSNKYSVCGHEVNQYKKDYKGDYYVAEKIIKGYVFRANLSIKEQLEKDLVDKIWKALSSCGNEVTFSVEFLKAHDDVIKGNLSVDAIVACRQKANLLAKAAGAKVIGLKHADYDFERGCLTYSSCACSAFDKSDRRSQVPAFFPSDIDVNCFVSTSWDIELLPPDDLL